MAGLSIAIALGSIFPRVANACPRDLPTVVGSLLEDLPGYANRVIRRSRFSGDRETYIITAGRPEFEPLPLGSTRPLPASADAPKQVFFTTLEQSFEEDRVIPRENYHWLFLASTEDGWRMVTIFTRYGSLQKDKPPAPPRETSNGAIGQAVRLWLRDCRN
ncbi:MAG: hypothetical protein J7647_08860 [Cyanobacteria bacterium SBLK]|nr:hypothetical protein [Cyanobacteria bacterium SBLK]